jgi:flagellar hook protein FlgE
MDVNIDFTNITQFGTPNSITAGQQDGYAPGVLQSFSISQTGVVSGIYSNGSTRDVAQIALCSFRNPAGLLKNGDSMYLDSANSGIPQIGESMTGSRGSISAGTLEMSNVDLSTEFTNMIIAQRGFQANSKTIQTAADMLTTLVNLIR